jgi:hypothetical protein
MLPLIQLPVEAPVTLLTTLEKDHAQFNLGCKNRPEFAFRYSIHDDVCVYQYPWLNFKAIADFPRDIQSKIHLFVRYPISARMHAYYLLVQTDDPIRMTDLVSSFASAVMTTTLNLAVSVVSNVKMILWTARQSLMKSMVAAKDHVQTSYGNRLRIVHYGSVDGDHVCIATDGDQHHKCATCGEFTMF